MLAVPMQSIGQPSALGPQRVELLAPMLDGSPVDAVLYLGNVRASYGLISLNLRDAVGCTFGRQVLEQELGAPRQAVEHLPVHEGLLVGAFDSSQRHALDHVSTQTIEHLLIAAHLPRSSRLLSCTHTLHHAMPSLRLRKPHLLHGFSGWGAAW
jgi:hypothetical protein